MRIFPGKYVMVVGELYQSETGQDLVIKSSKVQDLTLDAMASRMWRVEVTDFQKYAL